MEIIEKFYKLLRSLEENDIEYILIGGFAMIIYGMPRFTEDIDLFIKNDSLNIDKLKNALKTIYNDSSIDLLNVDEFNNYSVIRYGTPDGLCIDLLAKIGEIAVFNDLKYQVVEYEGVKIKVATPETLHFLKTNTMRLIDKKDALFLEEMILKNRHF
jgi:predicted nucleotidyltransferase